MPTRRSLPRWLGIVMAMAIAASLAGCGSDDGDHPPMLGDSFLPTSDAGTAQSSDARVDLCAKPGQQGCPCDQQGAVVECGKILERYGDYVTCSKGHSWCDGTTWGECVGNRVVTEKANSGDPLAGGGTGGASN